MSTPKANAKAANKPTKDTQIQKTPTKKTSVTGARTAKAPSKANAQPTAAELLRQMTEAGISLSDLMSAASPGSKPLPTVSEYRTRVEHSLSAGAVETYKSYFNDLDAVLGDTPIDKVTTTDLKILMKRAFERARKSGRKGSHGRSAAEHLFRLESLLQGGGR